MRRSNLNNVIVRLFTSLVFFAAGCTYSTSKYKNPIYRVTSDVIDSNLKTLVRFETVNVLGTETTSNVTGKTSLLEVMFINTVNEPSDEIQFKILAKKIASQFKSELKDPNEYDQYKISFGLLKNTENETIARKYISFIFKNDELKV